ncbi:MAG: hypothetical protein ACLQGV_04575 [Bryobacteraceae bacterium]
MIGLPPHGQTTLPFWHWAGCWPLGQLQVMQSRQTALSPLPQKVLQLVLQLLHPCAQQEPFEQLKLAAH